MRQRTSGTTFRVQGQGRAYVAVVGVTVGMLFAGLAVPLAFGRTADTGADDGQASVQLDPGFAAGASAGPGDSPVATATPDGTSPSTAGGAPTLPGASAAPGSTSTAGANSPQPGANGGTGSSGATGLTATDQGVTASTVKVGVVLLDIRKLEPVGFAQPHFTPDEQQQRFQSFFDRINKDGGLSGRRIAPVYRTWDALDSNGDHSGPAVCSQLAEDEKVFATLGFLDGNIAECLTQQWGIPSIANVGHIVEAYTKGRNLLATPFAALERGTANWGYLAATSGLLNGRKTGTVTTNIAQETRPEQTLADGLKAEGRPVTYRAKLAGDQASAQSQLPVEVSKMQQAGVDTVFLVTSFVTALQFVQTAEKQGFRPLYVVSDLGSLQAEGLVRNMPDSFSGAYLFTQGLRPGTETPENTKCRLEHNAHNGNAQDWSDLKEEGGSLTLICWMVRVFEKGANRVGPGLTRKGMGTAFQQLTGITLPHTQPGSFKSGKTDWADYMRIAKYATSCRCYQPVAESRRGRY